MSKVITRPPVCLTIGGSDSGGGAGIQADLRMFERVGVHGCSVITALTAQNPMKILRIEPASLAQLEAEMEAVFSYFDVQVVKTGMLVDAEHVTCVASFLERFHTDRLLVVDPVMVASSGTRLLDEHALTTLVDLLLPQATLITPNLDEAVMLLGSPSSNDSVELATALLLRYRTAVLVKGGHGVGTLLHDFLCDKDGTIHVFSHQKQDWNRNQAHGTGCRLAACIAALIAKKNTLAQASQQAIAMLQGSVTENNL